MGAASAPVEKLNLSRVQDVGLLGADDPAILAWAAAENRILLTYNQATIPRFAYDRVRANLAMPEIFLVRATMPIG